MARFYDSTSYPLVSTLDGFEIFTIYKNGVTNTTTIQDVIDSVPVPGVVNPFDQDLNTTDDPQFAGTKWISRSATSARSIMLGTSTGNATMTGNGNILMGDFTGSGLTTGSFNIMLGDYTGVIQSTGSDNVFIGSAAGKNTIDCDVNVAIGYFAGEDLESSTECVCIGYYAGNTQQNSTQNVCIGSNAGQSHTNGTYYNICMGIMAGAIMDGTIAGYQNIYMGYYSGFNSTDASDNVGIGYECLRNNDTGANNVAIGYQAGYYNADGDDNVYIGNNTAITNVGSWNVCIGLNAGEGSYTNSFYYSNVFIGENAADKWTTGDENVVIGYYAGTFSDNGNNNVVLGPYAGGGSAVMGDQNIIMGLTAAQDAENGLNNIWIGEMAGLSVVDGTRNVGLGYRCGVSNAAVTVGTGIDNNVMIGVDACSELRDNAQSNVAIGWYPSRYIYDGTYNVAIGHRAGYGVLNTSSYNHNIFLGFQAGNTHTTGNNNILIGKNANLTDPTTHNNCMIGGIGADAVKVGVGVAAPVYTVDVAGDVNVTGNFKVNGVDFTSGVSWDTVDANIVPTGATNTYDLGTLTDEFKDLHLAGAVYKSGTELTPVVASATAPTDTSVFWIDTSV